MSTPRASDKNSRSGDVGSSNQVPGNNNLINRERNCGQGNKKQSYKGDSADLGLGLFYIGNINHTNNFGTVYKTIISYIHREYTHGSDVAEYMEKEEDINFSTMIPRSTVTSSMN